jgi:phage terminase small subunit
VSPKQQRFVEEYLVDLNATQAAIRAGYSPRSANANAARMMVDASIQSAIATAMAERSERTQVTADMVLKELAVLDFSDVTNYDIDDNGNVKLKDHAPRSAMRAVSSLKKKITHGEYGISYETEIKLWSKPAALNMTGKHLKMFTDQVEHTGAGGGPLPPLQIILTQPED